MSRDVITVPMPADLSEKLVEMLFESADEGVKQHAANTIVLQLPGQQYDLSPLAHRVLAAIPDADLQAIIGDFMANPTFIAALGREVLQLLADRIASSQEIEPVIAQLRLQPEGQPPPSAAGSA